MAQTGPDGCTLGNMHQNDGCYDRVIDATMYLQEELTHGAHPCAKRLYRAFWPIPQEETDANAESTINRTLCYTR